MANTSNYTLDSANVTNVDTAPDFFLSGIHDLTGGAWGPMLLGMVFTISFLGLSRFDTERAFAVASFNTLITNILLTPFGIVGTYTFTLSAVLVGLAVVLSAGGDTR